MEEQKRMTERNNLPTRHDLEAKIVKRCWEDEAFRKEFTADPAGAFTRYLEVPAASLPKILVHEEAPGSWHIILPAKPANTSELSEEDLEKVAGGASPVVVSAATAVVSVLGTAMTTALATYISYVSLENGGW
jgi:hypothetical protein